ncbi:hypothetical protein QR98_0016930 [Sarcoptes scabiei]|uniref:Uncharacterized protein n=1 Tax=Sarcoptes scabiei TaxID=52283 RepID=A0A131ZX47_SARSC|nr:hypothetical protein QR98_0016930 [Sarcoptes scabiei]
MFETTTIKPNIEIFNDPSSRRPYENFSDSMFQKSTIPESDSKLIDQTMITTTASSINQSIALRLFDNNGEYNNSDNEDYEYDLNESQHSPNDEDLDHHNLHDENDEDYEDSSEDYDDDKEERENEKTLTLMKSNSFKTNVKIVVPKIRSSKGL